MSNGCPSYVADAAVIQQDQFVARRESINERSIPVSARRREAIQDQKERAFADRATDDLGAINRDHL